jgi:hypothetical protein
MLMAVAALLPAYLAWPYTTLWGLDRAVRSSDADAFADLVDLEAVRGEIKKKLNKDSDSAIGDLSDAFIQWLEEGIALTGSDAVDRLVTLAWVRGRLLRHSGDDSGDGFLGQVTYAFFDAPDGFVARVGPAAGDPIHLRLTLSRLRWRVSAVYY